VLYVPVFLAPLIILGVWSMTVTLGSYLSKVAAIKPHWLYGVSTKVLLIVDLLSIIHDYEL
jgi:hypothetical protein